MGIFRNTSNPFKLYEITLLHTGSSAYYSIYESDESSLCRWCTIFKCMPGSIFIIELKFSDIVPNTMIILNKIKTDIPKIGKISYLYPLNLLLMSNKQNLCNLWFSLKWACWSEACSKTTWLTLSEVIAHKKSKIWQLQFSKR